ncbi:MAG TPA: hypothetical protein VHM70_06240 [Polyangiaceae bacterium]|nr:hypothetical protein [Polyangiaceae bacterium]
MNLRHSAPNNVVGLTLFLALSGCASNSPPQANAPTATKATPAPVSVAAPSTTLAASGPASSSSTDQSVAEAEPATEAGLRVPHACEATSAPESVNLPATPSSSKASVSCFPPSEFVERLCGSVHASAALTMLQTGSPWKRVYLKGETKAWSAARTSQQEDRLKFNEEVLVLQSNNGEGGALAGQGDSFYALRWNGSCVKLTEEEVSELAPWRKLAAPIPWSWLDESTKDALSSDKKVADAVSTWKKTCRKASPTDAHCIELQQHVTDAIVARVQSGATLPDPEPIR